MTSSQILFFVNGKKFILDEKSDPDETLSAFLRRNGVTSSKIGCQEGSCGSCAVAVGKWDQKKRKAKFSSVNACLTPVFLLHHCLILTAEGIGKPDSMHPVQERLARGHGSQCGYCTPGFVLAMYALLRNNPNPSDYEIRQAIRGNICRCTGYRPIVEALSSFSSGCGGCTGAKDGKCCREVDPEAVLEQKLVKWDDFPKYDPTQEIIFPPELIKIISETSSTEFPVFEGKNLTVAVPSSLVQLVKINFTGKTVIVSSGLATVSRRNKTSSFEKELWISLQNCKQTNSTELNGTELIIGASATITDLRNAIAEIGNQKLNPLVWFLDQFSSNHVRNNATWTGSLLSKFGDIPSLALALGMKLHCYDLDLKQTQIMVVDGSFFENMDKILPNDGRKVVVCGVIDLDGIELVRTAKFDATPGNLVNLVQIVKSGGDARVAAGGFTKFCTLVRTSNLDDLLEVEDFKKANNFDNLEPLIAQANREKLLTAPEFESLQLFQPPTNNNNQEYWSVGRPIAHQYADRHTTGTAVYTGDVQPAGMFHLAPVMSSKPHAEILSVDPSEALKVPGVVDFVSVKDVPGTNVPGADPMNDLIDDTEVFADKKALYIGHIIGGIVAESPLIARKAAKLVKIEYKDLEPIFSIQEAKRKESFFMPKADTVICGENVDECFEKCDFVVEGTIGLDGQQHVYLETQSAVAVPGEDNEWTIYSSTQAPTMAQIQSALVLGINKNQIVVKVKRVGGGFGGKCGAQSGYALYPALVAANKLKRPISCVFTREEDFTITGGRHPADCFYKLGCDSDGRIIAGKFVCHTLGGYSIDNSVWVASALCHSIDNCYKIPNLNVQVYACRTNTPSNTAMRGYGQPQAYFFIENALDQLARKVGIQPEEIRERNFSREGEIRADGTEIVFDNLRQCWDKCKQLANFEKLREEIKEFNQKSTEFKRGLALMPTRFGVMHGKLFEQTFVLVTIYLDGSVGISIGGIEMGQGLNTKVLQVASNELNLPMEKITILENSTEKTANAPVTGGSQGADLHGFAVKKACQKLMQGLKPLMEANPKMSWAEIVRLANLQRVALSAGEHCTYPRRPTADGTDEADGPCYHTSGAACVVAEVDLKTGEHCIKSVQIVLDTGHSLNPAVDIGQIEGAFIQMYGLMTMESITIDEKTGRVIANNLFKYRLPRAQNVPEKFHVMLLGVGNDSTGAIYSSKSTGEPPLMLGAGTYFAITDALFSVDPVFGQVFLRPPLTPLAVTKALKKRGN